MNVHRRSEFELPIHLKVPVVHIERKWPDFSDSRIDDPYSQDNVVLELELIWSRLSEPVDDLDSTDYWGGTAKFIFEDEEEPIDQYKGTTDQPLIAIANYRKIEAMWTEFLPRLQMVTYPPKDVLLVMVQEAFASYDVDAWQMVYQHHKRGADKDWWKENRRIITFLEEKIRDAVSLLRPTMHMFFASIWSQRGRMAKPPLIGETVGPFPQKTWASILDVSERHIQDQISSGKWRKHDSSRKAKIVFYVDGLPPDAAERIDNWMNQNANRHNRQNKQSDF